MIKIPPCYTFDTKHNRVMSVAPLEQRTELGGGQYIYKLYNQYKKDLPKKYRINDKTQMIGTFSALLKEWSNLITETEAGLVLRNFGYFFVARRIKKVPAQTYYDEDGVMKALYTTKNGMRPSQVMFVPSIKRNSDLFGWSMDALTTGTLQNREVRKNTYRNIKYKGYPYSFKQIKLI